MSGESSGPTDFFDVASRLQLLDVDAADLRAEVTRAGISPAELVLRRGLLDTVQVDIIETLRNPNATIPGYEILDVIGRGAMGVVYRARQLNLERIVALKTILVSQMTDRTAVDRFALEGRTVGRLRHPNVIAAFDLGRYEGRLFLAMEYVEGIDLEQRLRRLGQLDETSTWHIARQTAGGLAQAAELGIVHRDIKPANLMLVDPPPGYPLPAGVPMVKVADFGLALLTHDEEASERLTTENTTVGSPYYMAPEQFESSHVGPAADFYALGATVYHALAGRPPFHGLTVPQIISAKMQREPDDLRNIRPGLSDTTYQLVERLLIRRPEERLTDYNRLLELVDRILGNASQTMKLSSTSAPIDAGAITQMETHVDEPVAKRGSIAPTDDFPGAATTDEAMSPLPAPAAERSRRFVWIAFAVLLAAGAGAALFLEPWNTAPPEKPPERIPTTIVGVPALLFDGRSTNGWEHRSGNWIVPPRFPALEGMNGVIGRPLLRPNEDENPLAPKLRPRDWYRVELSLQPVDDPAAGVQEVHFGLEAHAERDGRRYVLRRTKEGLEIGTREADHGAFVPLEGRERRAVAADSVVPITFERLPTGWFVELEDATVLAFPRAERELPEFRLACEGGTARFSDFLVMDLQP